MTPGPSLHQTHQELGVGGGAEGGFAVDEAVADEGGEGALEGDHAVVAAGEHGVPHEVVLALADAVGDGGGDEEFFHGGDESAGAGGDEALREDGAQG